MHDRCGAVRTSIINNEDVKTLFQAENGTYNLLDILLLIVSRDYHNRITFMHSDVRFYILQTYIK